MRRIDDFFISKNAVGGITEDHYNTNEVDSLINMADTISRITYQSLYIIDYHKKNFLHVSNNPMFLNGVSADEVKEMGYMFYLNHVPEEDVEMLLEINRAGFEFYDNVPVEERLDYVISYDFHLKLGRKKNLINHKLTPALLDGNGRIWFALCAVSLSTRTKPGHVKMSKINQPFYWEYSFESRRWSERSEIVLSEREKDVLTMSARGYTMNEIGDELCMSIDTVKFHKKKLFEKLQVKNITEALYFATSHKLL